MFHLNYYTGIEEKAFQGMLKRRRFQNFLEKLSMTFRKQLTRSPRVSKNSTGTTEAVFGDMLDAFSFQMHANLFLT